MEQQSRTAVAFDTRSCLRSRYNRNECDRCLSVCHTHALILNERIVSFSSASCSECHACVAACPTDAITCTFDLSTVLSALHYYNGEAPLILTCGKSGCYANQFLIPCIGLFSEPVLASMHCASAKDFLLDVHRCASCENHAVLDRLQQNIRSLSDKLLKPGELKIQLLHDRDQHQSRLHGARRFFLQQAASSLLDWGREASAKLFVTNAKAPDRMEKEKNVSETSRLLETALDITQQENGKYANLLYSYRFHVTTDASCDCCSACSGMCPTGALKRVLVDGEKRLLFSSTRCNGCGLCVAFCRKKAIHLHSGASASDDRQVVLATA